MHMLLTMLLSRVLGLFLVILGALILLRRRYYLSVFAEFGRARLTRTVISMAELLAGLFLLVIHNRWSSFAAGLVSLIGWMAVLESLIYLALPDRIVEKFLKTFNTPGWYLCGGVLAIATGLYLAAYGFGLAG
jgi:hypothetical protein